MAERSGFRFLNFKYRRIIHYSLILCLLLIQALIGGYFYNEYIAKRKIVTIERKLAEIHVLETLTDDSKNKLLNAGQHLQNYFLTKSKDELQNYFDALNEVGKNLEILEKDGHKYPKIDNALTLNKTDNILDIKDLKKITDSVYTKTIEVKPKPVKEVFPEIKQYGKINYDFHKYDVETKTYSDTIKKKSLFGRLKDAIQGKETVKKDSTVTTLKQTAVPNSVKLQQQLDSIVNSVNSHYTKEIQKVKIEVENRQQTAAKNNEFPKVFGDLLLYNNGLMSVYGNAINNSKADLQREFDAQNSKSNKIRIYLVFAAMALMFIVSVLIMLLTRLAYIFERELKNANDQIEQNLNFKSRILGMLSHEMRAPLKIVDLFIKRINKKVDDKDVREYLKSISFTNNSLLMQANQILEYTKNQKVESKLVPGSFNLKNEIDSILKAIVPYIEARNNRFIVREEINPQINVYSDNAKIHQLFLNIIGNANKFTENGTITVKAMSSPTENGYALKTEVADTGAGISESDLKMIFEPYYQGLLSDEVENLGAGLGLSLCKEIVELFDGNIEVSSKKNVGTTVAFTINLKKG